MMPKDIPVVITGGGSSIDISLGEVRSAAEHPTALRTASHNKEVSGPNVISAETDQPLFNVTCCDVKLSVLNQ